MPGKIHLSQHILRAVLLVNKYVLKLEMIHSNQAELNKIKMNDNHEIFEVPEQNKNPRRRILDSLCKNV
jgi:hypothetical protein